MGKKKNPKTGRATEKPASKSGPTPEDIATAVSGMGQGMEFKSTMYPPDEKVPVEKPAEDAIASAEFVDWLLEQEQERQRQRKQAEIIQRFVDANAEQAAPPISPMELAWNDVHERMNAEAEPPIPTVVIGSRRRRWVVPVLLAVGVVGGGLLGAAAKDRELRPTIHLLNRAMDVVAARARSFEGAATAQSVELHALRDANARLNLERGGAMQMLEQDEVTERAAAHDLRRARTALRYDQDVDRVSDRAKTWVALRAVEKAERRLNEQP